MATFTIHDDSTPERDLQPPSGTPFGLELPERGDAEYVYGGLAEPFPRNLLIPRHEWQARIEERKARGTTLLARSLQVGLPMKNQSRTSLCWAFGPTKAMELIRLTAGLPMVSLSPASVSGPINGYRNQGGWGKRALERIVSHGAVPSARWGDIDIDRRNATEENWTLARDYRVTEWWELRPRNIDEHISCLLHGWPVTVGLNYWRHQVTDIDADWLDGRIAVLFDNSYGPNWGTNGRGWRQGSRLLADDAVVPRVAIAA